MTFDDARRVLVIAGPTAVGKTALSLELASRTSCEIISADSRQIYRGMNIGTAKPTARELAQVRHHCVDICEPGAPYNAAQYAHDVAQVLHSMDATVLPIVVGGSGLYIRAAFDGLSPTPNVDDAVREQLQRELEVRGRDELYQELQTLDAVAAEKYSDRNPRRITRALEYIRSTGRPFSETWNAQNAASPYSVSYVALTCERSQLYSRINERCHAMWTGGLLEETQALLDAGISRSAQCMQTVGYAEAAAYLSGELRSDAALEAMCMATRQYAKRQLTWFKRDTRYVWYTGDTQSVANSIMREFVNSR